MDHLALATRDQDACRRFYETYCGFGARPARRYDDDTLMLYDERGFALALGRADRGFVPHVGRTLPDAQAVRDLAERLERDGVPIVERWDEPGYVSVKVRDPDGNVVELFWEQV